MFKPKLCFPLIVCAMLTACAHPLVISPDINKVTPSLRSNLIPKSVGYYISPELLEKKVTTSGGGGDSVIYTPYKDTETAFYKMLTNVFTNVTRLKTPSESAVISKQSIDYIIVPEIATSSSSPSAFTWPPTQFNVNLTCKISDPTGKTIAQLSVVGAGHAEFDEFRSDFSLSGKRASEDALLKMQEALLKLPELKSN